MPSKQTVKNLQMCDFTKVFYFFWSSDWNVPASYAVNFGYKEFLHTRTISNGPNDFQ